MAIITLAKFGLCGPTGVCLYLVISDTEESSSALHLSIKQTIELVKAYGVDDIRRLIGKPIWMTPGRVGDETKIVGPCLIEVANV